MLADLGSELFPRAEISFRPFRDVDLEQFVAERKQTSTGATGPVKIAWGAVNGG